MAGRCVRAGGENIKSFLAKLLHFARRSELFHFLLNNVHILRAAVA